MRRRHEKKHLSGPTMSNGLKHCSKRLHPIWLASLTVAVSPLFHATSATANSELDVPNGTTDLTSLGATTSSDLTFTNTTYSPTAFTISGATMAIGTLNDLAATQSLSISNQSATNTSTLTLDGGSDSVSGSNPNDLIFVSSTSTLSINGSVVTGQSTEELNLAVAAAGDFDVSGSLSISAALVGASAITKTGSGVFALSPTPASAGNTGFTGGFSIENGTVILSGATNAPNNDLGASNTTVNFGTDSNNVTLNFSSTASAIAQNFVVGGTGVDTITSSAGSATVGNAAVFAATNTITLENNLTVSNTIAQTALNGNILGFRGVINQSGGTYGITVAATNVGTVDLRANNTFGGGVTIDGGQVSLNLGSTGSPVTSGPLGTGTTTLGGAAATSATLTDAGAFSIGNALVIGSATGSATRTIEETSNSTTAGAFNGPVTLNANVILTAVTVSAASGNDRLRIGAGGITGNGNIIINNPNNQNSSTTNRNPIIISGNATPTTWTGNLIVQAGDGAIGLLNGVNAVGPNNVVEIGSNASLDFSSSVSGQTAGFSPTVAGLEDFGTITSPGLVYESVANSETLTLAGSGAYSYSGSIANSINATPATTALRVALTGTGNQTLSGASTYSGPTIVDSGTLTVANTSGSATGTSTVTLNGGVLASGAVGTISGNVLAGTNSHTIAPGGIGSIGTLNIGGLTSSSLTTLNFDLGTGSGTITNGDNLILGSGTVSIASGTNLTFGGTPVAGNDYQLIGGSISGISLGNFTLPAAPAGLAYSLTVNSGFIDLDVTSGGPVGLTWDNAAGTGLWNTTDKNWNNGNATYADGSNVTFDDNNGGAGNYAVTLNSVVSPGSITANNSAGNYTISGSGSIAGGGSLNKNGSGVFTINTAGTSLGAVTVNNGSVQLGTSTGLATMTSLSIGANATFDVNNNHVIIDYGTGPDPISSIAALLKTGYNHGDWNGLGGIISTAAQLNNATPGNLLYGLGYADSTDSGNPAGLASGTIEIKYTLLGDANLSGVVDGTDFGIVAANFNKGVTGWDQGDFNYDNVVDGTDFGDLAANFNKGASGAAAWQALESFAAANGLLADVPEPASLSLLALSACGILARRRKSKRG